MYRTARLISCLAIAVTSTAIHPASASAQPGAPSSAATSSARPDLPRNVGYTPPANFGQLPRVLFREAQGSGSESDTQRLADLIDEMSQRRTEISRGVFVNGGVIRVASGQYRMRNVTLKSNVHLRFGPDVTIVYETQRIRGFGGVSIFDLSGGISNVSIAGNSRQNRLKLIGPPTPEDPLAEERFRSIRIRGVTNFLVTNIAIDNQQSRFVSIFMGGEGTNAAEAVEGPRPVAGEISNINAINNVGGFGTIQAHTASRVKFDNIRGEGGVTLRLETGVATANGLTDIDATNIRVRRGRCGVLFQPHGVRSHNRIRIRGVEAIESGFAVEVLEGFVSSRDRALNDPRFSRPGRFQNVSIEDVTARIGIRPGAQVRPSAFRLIPGSSLSFLPNAEDFLIRFRLDGDTLLSRPLGAVLNRALTYRPFIDRSSIDASGLPRNLRRPRIITPATPDRNNDHETTERRLRDLLSATRAAAGRPR